MNNTPQPIIKSLQRIRESIAIYREYDSWLSGDGLADILMEEMAKIEPYLDEGSAE